MAVDLIDANSTRYYSVPDDASLTFPDSDWFLAFWTRVDDNTGSFFQYLFSNNGFEAANSLNIFVVEDSGGPPTSGKWRATTGSGGRTDSVSAPGGDGLNRLIVVQRNGSTKEMFFCLPGASPSTEGTATLSAAINGGVWNIGRRVDGNTDRYYEEHFGDFIKGTVALTSAQIELLARGVPITQIVDPASLDVWFQFREATSQVVDIIGGNIATRNGSGLLTSEHFLYTGNIIPFIPTVMAASAASLLLIQQSFRQ